MSVLALDLNISLENKEKYNYRIDWYISWYNYVV